MTDSAREVCEYCDAPAVETLANGPAMIHVCGDHASFVP